MLRKPQDSHVAEERRFEGIPDGPGRSAIAVLALPGDARGNVERVEIFGAAAVKLGESPSF